MDEQGIELPHGRIPPDTLRSMLVDYVSREWSDLGDDGYTLEDKLRQVLRQLDEGRARVLYDLTSETWNIVEIGRAHV